MFLMVNLMFYVVNLIFEQLNIYDIVSWMDDTINR